MTLPTDAATAAYVDGGELWVIDGRGTPWKFDASKVKPAAGQTKAKCPTSFKAAWVRADRLNVIDSENTAWAYNFGDGTWTKGPKVEVAETDPPQDSPWQYGQVLLPVHAEDEAA